MRLCAEEVKLRKQENPKELTDINVLGNASVSIRMGWWGKETEHWLCPPGYDRNASDDKE